MESTFERLTTSIEWKLDEIEERKCWKYSIFWRNKHLDGKKRGTEMDSLPRDHWGKSKRRQVTNWKHFVPSVEWL